VAKNYPVVAAGETVSLFRSHRPDFADGGQLRDFVYVKDCVSIACWLLDQQPRSGLYNVGSGKARSFADLVRAVGAALDVEPTIAYVDMPEAIRDKYQYFTEASMGKLRDAGYAAPLTQLEDGVRDYVTNHLAPSQLY
jgi:ADP-L-glycero-D-manno-heptose 6-epimerase